MGDFAQKVNLPNGRKTKSTKNTSVWTLPFEVMSVHERVGQISYKYFV